MVIHICFRRENQYLHPAAVCSCSPESNLWALPASYGPKQVSKICQKAEAGARTAVTDQVRKVPSRSLCSTAEECWARHGFRSRKDADDTCFRSLFSCFLPQAGQSSSFHSRVTWRSSLMQTTSKILTSHRMTTTPRLNLPQATRSSALTNRLVTGSLPPFTFAFLD